MLLHYGVDAVYYTGKLFVAVGHVFMSRVSTVAFGTSYFVLRIVLLAKVVIGVYFNSTDEGFHSSQNLITFQEDAQTPYEASSFGLCINKYCLSSWKTLMISSILLYMMHIYWFAFLLVQVKRIIVTDGVVRDYREMEKKQE